MPDAAGETLAEEEFDLFLLLLVVAGNETTRNAASGGMLAFFENPEQWQRLLADPSLARTASDEIVRWVSPVNLFRRTATVDTMIGGQEIKADDKVVMFYSSANRDEDVFADPASFDIGRDPNPHIGFGGGGPHFCLGNHLAKLELRVLFEVLLERLPDMALAGAGAPAPLQLHQRHQGPSGHPRLTTGRDARTGPAIMPALPEADPACSAALPHTHGTPGHDEHRAGDPPRCTKTRAATWSALSRKVDCGRGDEGTAVGHTQAHRDGRGEVSFSWSFCPPSLPLRGPAGGSPPTPAASLGSPLPRCAPGDRAETPGWRCRAPADTGATPLPPGRGHRGDVPRCAVARLAPHGSGRCCPV